MLLCSLIELFDIMRHGSAFISIPTCLGECLVDIEAWLKASHLRLNPSKTQINSFVLHSNS